MLAAPASDGEQGGVTPFGALDDIVPSSSTDRDAAKAAYCLNAWPPRGGATLGEELLPLQKPEEAEVYGSLSQALRLRQPSALIYRFFLLLAKVERSLGGRVDLSGAARELQHRRCVVREVEPLQRTTDEDVALHVLLLVQPWLPVGLPWLQQLLQNPALSRGCSLFPAPGRGDEASAVHWRDTHLQVIRRFPEFFQVQWQVLITQAMPSAGVHRLAERLLLHDFGIKAIQHRLPDNSAPTVKAVAVIVARGLGQVLACDVGGPRPGGEEAKLAAEKPSDQVKVQPPAAGVPAAPASTSWATTPTPAAKGGNVEIAAAAETQPALWCGMGLPANTAVYPSIVSARKEKAMEMARLPSEAEGEVEISTLIVLADAVALGAADVARELLLLNGFLVLLEKKCRLEVPELRVVLGLPPADAKPLRQQSLPDGSGMYLPGYRPSLQTWFEHLLHKEHQLFVVRRSDGISLLQQLCYGPTLTKAGAEPHVLEWHFVQQPDAMRPGQPPVFTSLHGLLAEASSADRAGHAHPPRPSVPMLAIACHSSEHACAVVAKLSPELLRSEEMAVVLPSAPVSTVGSPEQQVSLAPQGITMDFINRCLTASPLGCTILQTTTAGPALLEWKAGAGSIDMALVQRGAARWALAAPTGTTAMASLCVRVGLVRELAAAEVLWRRRKKRLSLQCPLSEAYAALLSRGAIFLTDPADVDTVVHHVWPAASLLSGLTPDALSRSLRLVEPCFGFAAALGIAAEGAMRADLRTWEPGSMVWHWTAQQGQGVTAAEVELAGVRVHSQLTVYSQPAGDGLGASVVAEQALRLLLLHRLLEKRAPRGQPGQAALPKLAQPQAPRWRGPQAMLFPRNEPSCAILLLRDAAPWHSLADYPLVYETEGTVVVVALLRAELMEIDFDSALRVRADIGSGKVRCGWQLLKGADVPLSTRDGAMHEVFTELVRRSSGRPTTLVFQDPGAMVPTVAVARARALAGVELCSGGVVPTQMAVERRKHAATEALLVGATLARLVIAAERTPISLAEAEAALLEVRQSAHGVSQAVAAELLPRSSSSAFARLAPVYGSASKPSETGSDGADLARAACRVLCNETCASALEVWRVIAAWAPNVDAAVEDAVYTMLNDVAWQNGLEGMPSSFLSLETLPRASEVLLCFAGGIAGLQPDLHLLGPVPVLGCSGRLAAQMYLMLRLDSSLAPFVEGAVQRALCTRFLRTHEHEAGGKQPQLRLHFHCVLCLLEALWMEHVGLTNSLPVSKQHLLDILFEEILQASKLLRDAGVHADIGAGVGSFP